MPLDTERRDGAGDAPPLLPLAEGPPEGGGLAAMRLDVGHELGGNVKKRARDER